MKFEEIPNLVADISRALNQFLTKSADLINTISYDEDNLNFIVTTISSKPDKLDRIIALKFAIRQINEMYSKKLLTILEDYGCKLDIEHCIVELENKFRAQCISVNTIFEAY